MAGANPAMYIRIAASTEELKRNLKEGLNQIEALTGGMQKYVNSFKGDKLIQQAHNLTAAIDQVGGVTKLTRAEQDRANSVLERAIEKYRVLGKEPPAALLKIAEETKKVGGTSAIWSDLKSQIAATAAGFLSAQAIIGTFRAAWHALTGFLSSSITEWTNQETAIKKLNVALQTAGQFTPALSQQYQDLGTQYQQTTVYQDDLIESMEALLVQVGKVAPAQMKGALAASTDLASGLGVDLNTATLLVAKAFAGETSTLSRYGIVIDETAKKTQGAAEATISAIEKSFGGQAQAEIETTAGKLKQAANAWGDFKEAVGKALVESEAGRQTLSTMRTATQDLTKENGGLGKSFLDVAADMGVWLSNPNLARIKLVGEELQAQLVTLQKMAETKLPSTLPATAQPAGPTGEAAAAELQKELKAAQDAAAEAAKRHEAALRIELATMGEVNKQVGYLTPALESLGMATGDVAIASRQLGDGMTVLAGALDHSIHGVQRIGSGLATLPDAEAIAAAAAKDFGTAGATAFENVQQAAQGVAAILDNLPGKFAQVGAVAARTIDAVMTNLSSGNVLGAVVAGVTGTIQAIKGLFGGPSQAELAGRQVVSQFESQFGSTDEMINKVGEAYRKLGKSSEEAQAAITRLWAAEKQGPEATKRALDEINAALDHASRLDQMASQFGPSKAELEQMAADAKATYEYMQQSGQYSAEQIEEAFKASIAAAAAAGDTAAAAQQQAQTAAQAHYDEAKKQLDALTAQRDSLFQQVSNEAPEEVAGVIETAARAQIGVLDDQIAAQQENLKKQAEDMKTQLETALESVAPDAVHVPVVWDIPPLPEPAVQLPAYHTGGMVAAWTRAHAGLNLAADEVPIVVQTGERVLNRQETAAYNAGGRGSTAISVNVDPIRKEIADLKRVMGSGAFQTQLVHAFITAQAKQGRGRRR